MRITRRSWLSAAAALLVLTGLGAPKARAEDTIKIGILHSLSGTMAISETILKDLMLMQVAEINANGGLLGKKIEPVVVDPASNWPLFAEKARELISKDKVAAVFGCWTSVSRKSVLPVFEELNGLLFYPLEYEGEESSYNVFYGSSVPDNKAIPAVKYLMSADGGGVKRFVLEGTDYVYPRTSNKIIRAYPEIGRRRRRGHPRELHAVRLLRLADRGRRDQGVRLGGQEDGGGLDHQRRRQRAVLQGARQSGRQGDRHSGDRLLGRRGGARRRRHQAAGRPSRGLELFRKRRHAGEQGLHREVARLLQEADKASPTTRWNSAYILFHMWVQAVEQAGTTDVDAVRQAMIGQKFKSPSGVEVDDAAPTITWPSR